MNADPHDEPEVDAEVESDLVEYEPELFIGDGELWLRDRDAFCERYGAIGIDRYEGASVALIPGRGAVPIGDLLKADKPGNIKAIK